MPSKLEDICYGRNVLGMVPATLWICTYLNVLASKLFSWRVYWSYPSSMKVFTF